MPEVESNIAGLDFLTAIQTVHPDFAIFQINRIQTDIRNNRSIDDLYTLIKLYRDYLRLVGMPPSRSYGAFNT